MTVWGRRDLTSFVLKEYQAVVDELHAEGITVDRFVAGSEGEASREICEAAGWKYLETPNEPLWEKWNLLLEFVRDNDAGYDLFIPIGSDNLINAAYIRVAVSLIVGEVKFAQPDGCVYLDLMTGRSSFLKGCQGGAGRVFARELVLRLNWNLWQENPMYSIDHWQYRLVTGILDRSKLEGRLILLPVRLAAPWQLVDIKSEANIWPWTDFSPERNPACSNVDTQTYFGDYFPNCLTLL